MDGKGRPSGRGKFYNTTGALGEFVSGNIWGKEGILLTDGREGNKT